MVSKKSKILSLMSFALMLLACEPDTIEDPVYYQIVNELIKNDRNLEVFVVTEPLHVYKPMARLFDFAKIALKKEDNLPPPLPPHAVDYMSVLVGWTVAGFLDSLEADYMYTSQDPNRKLLLDASKVNAKQIAINELEQAYRERKLFYHISYPLYNESHTKLILTVESPGNSISYLFTLINGKWIQRDKKTNWVSLI
jgi:hypothetical protein